MRVLSLSPTVHMLQPLVLRPTTHMFNKASAFVRRMCRRLRRIYVCRRLTYTFGACAGAFGGKLPGSLPHATFACRELGRHTPVVWGGGCHRAQCRAPLVLASPPPSHPQLADTPSSARTGPWSRGRGRPGGFSDFSLQANSHANSPLSV